MTENEKRDKARDKADEKFVRWQGIRITQLSYSINLILTFSVAAIGFGTSLLLNDDFQPTACVAWLYYVSLVFFLVSGGLGIWVTRNRLIDFRETADITNSKRERAKCRVERRKTCKLLKKCKFFRKCLSSTKTRGERTWCLFWWQLRTFSSGVILFCSFVILTRFFQ